MTSRAILIKNKETLLEEFKNHDNIKEIIDKYATSIGFIIVKMDLKKAYAIPSDSEILIRKDYSPEEDPVTIMNKWLQLKYPFTEAYRRNGSSVEYTNLIKREAQRLVKNNPDLPEYIFSKAKRIEN